MELIDKGKVLEPLVKCLDASDGDTPIVDSVLIATKRYIEGLPTVEAVTAEELMGMFGGEPPCEFNGWDECTDEWCEAHCQDNNTLECWKLFIRERWWEHGKTD